MTAHNQKKQLINAHTHTFSGNFVPPYLAKTYLPWPFYYLFHTGWIIRQFRKYYKFKYRREFADAKTEAEESKLWQEIYSKKKRKRRKVNIQYYFNNHWYLKIPYQVITLWLSAVAIIFFVDILINSFGLDTDLVQKIDNVKTQLSDYYLYFHSTIFFKIIFLVFVLVFIRWSRKLIFLMLKNIFPVFKRIMSKNTLELIERYYSMGRFSMYKNQRDIAKRLSNQLPPNSSSVILPMDMEYMGAGKTRFTKEMLESKSEKIQKKKWSEDDFKDVYKYQMRELWGFVRNKDHTGPKDAYFPFLFLDPRRIEQEGKDFFDYVIVDKKMVLKPCYIKTYMEDRRFSGFKIYPALGYYPFDENLLPIWRYASENNIPITSHCAIGTIFYRGKKKKEWNYHPVFMERYDKDNYGPKLLPQTKNLEFQVNFTHPMNYLCLVEQDFLKLVISKTGKNSEVRELYGYSEKNNELKHDLSKLKICLAHYGGEEEWIKYLERDRQNYIHRLIRNPVEAINFTRNSHGDFSWRKINDLWDKTDWYSIISSMLIRYENIYSDLSYIISKESIYPLLKYTLEKGDNFDVEHQQYLKEPDIHRKASHYTGKNKLRSRILFATDFYMVRNQKADKELLIKTKALLNQENFDLIARENTHKFLLRN